MEIEARDRGSVMEIEEATKQLEMFRKVYPKTRFKIEPSYKYPGLYYISCEL